MGHDARWAAEHAPVLCFDREEPFLPSRVGYTVLREPSDSLVDPRRTLGASHPLRIDLSGLEAPIEYGIWWDWDIQHLYDLEAAWVYLGTQGVLCVEASWHGRFHEMQVNGRLPMRGLRPMLYSQPGKHAFAPDPSWFEPREKFIEPCRDTPGSMGVLVTELFRGRIVKTAEDDARAAAYLQARAFTPSFVFDQQIVVGREHLCPWPELEAWIPGRVRTIMEELRDGRSLG
jgi:putative hydrolase of the HAD superfamily